MSVCVCVLTHVCASVCSMPVQAALIPSTIYYNNILIPHIAQFIVQELCESRLSWAVRPNEPSGFHGRKDLLNRASALVTTCP